MKTTNILHPSKFQISLSSKTNNITELNHFRVRVRDYLSSNEKYNLEKETKLVATNYYSSIQSAFETLHVKYNYYKKYPKDHPEYGAEWTAYRMKRLLKYRNILSNNLLIHDYKAGFKKQWDIIFEKLFFKEKQNLVLEIGIQLNLRLDSKQKPLPSTRKHETVQKTTTPARKRSCDEEQSVTDKRIKMSQDNTMPTLDVDKIPEQQNPMSFLSICQQIKGFMFGDLDVKISNIIDEASKSCNENNLKLLQNSKKFKLFEKIRLILIDQTTDNWRDVMKTNEIKKVIEMITVLLKNVVKIPKTKLTLLEDDIKILVLNFSELASQDQYDLISYLEIMKVKNSEFYEKITNTIKEEITLHSENESSLGVEEVIDDSIVISDDDDDDYDLTEVVIKAKQTVDETSCENDSELVTEEDIILNISSDEN